MCFCGLRKSLGYFHYSLVRLLRNHADCAIITPQLPPVIGVLVAGVCWLVRGYINRAPLKKSRARRLRRKHRVRVITECLL